MIRFLALAVALVAGCTGSGAPLCEQAALEGIAETLEREAASAGAEVRAIAGIGVACPRVHPGLVLALRHVYVRERVESLAVYDGLPEARWRVCADPDGWVRDVTTAPAERRPRIVFDRCGFARLGLLDEGEELLEEDIDVLFMTATLGRDGVDRALLRRLGRALMTSVAPLPVAARRCSAMPDSDACVRLLHVAGVEAAPVSVERDGPRDSPPRLLLSPTGLLWEGKPIAADVEGRRIASLAAAVAAWQPQERFDERLVLAPDRGLAFGVVLDALHTMAREGADKLALVGQGRYGLVEIPVFVPPAARMPNELAALPVVTIDGSAVSVSLRAGETKRLTVDAGAALREFAARASEAAPHLQGFVHVRMTRTTRVDDVIAVIDALRGADCPRDDAKGCLLSRPILDQEPPLE
ncbi:hypothetical protein OV203_33370 [Nannocystis sp. ILAH1]|uniref:hypothetical protein n=1 Tax=unclassified Nannocystis TaxID=2627009 RepID=UPI00226E5792|nr:MULTISPECIES: hypothetical protein [unclassified Nannocystis]MCY0992077.1 hypothetical protein [Nannocystis sp. ILAH1]MCY1064328.1 hypothetical protein [Nannocystis sp. RBIL2]